jgi:hypothetical protein
MSTNAPYNNNQNKTDPKPATPQQPPVKKPEVDNTIKGKTDAATKPADSTKRL